jgi:RNA-binding protein YhbY
LVWLSGVVFLISSFHFINKILVFFKFRIVIILLTLCAHTHLFILEVNLIFQLVSELGTLCLDPILKCYFLLLFYKMSQSLNIVTAFDGTDYGYWKARMRFFLNSIDCWSIVETGWTKPADATLELVPEKKARLSNDKALHALRQALSPSEFARIINSESAKEAWQILETTYEGTKLVKSAKLQMLISKFEEIKMLEDETFGEFYSKMSDLRNQMVSLGKTVLDVKLIRKILRSLPERFKIKVTTIEESRDLEEMKIEELVGSL